MPRTIDVFDSSHWSNDEKRYFATVDDACSASKDMLIGNGNAKHAVYLIDCFLRKSAQRKVRLFSGRLIRTAPCSGDRSLSIYANPRLVESAAAFLERPRAELHILLEEDLDVPGDDPKEHPLIARASQASGNFTVGKISPKWLSKLTKNNFMVHWMTVDDTGFRLERNTAEHTALANFRSKKHARRLSDLFDRMTEDAIPLAI